MSDEGLSVIEARRALAAGAAAERAIRVVDDLPAAQPVEEAGPDPGFPWLPGSGWRRCRAGVRRQLTST